MRTWLAGVLWGALLAGCSDDEDGGPVVTGECVVELEQGDPAGHSEPFGAKAAGQARAGRIDDASELPQPAHGQQRIEDGDFVLVNDRIAVVIEDVGKSDGYSRFGGEILSVDQVGEDGRPLGRSRFVETLACYGGMQPEVRSVTVLNDGSDGGEAVVRVIGRLTTIPFLGGSLANLLRTDFDLDVAYDYVLAPGAENVVLRVSVRNGSPDPIDFGVDKASNDELYGFFQSNHNRLVTPAGGFGDLPATNPWLGFIGRRTSDGVVASDWNFAWRAVDGDLATGIEVSGFHLFHGTAFKADGCAITTSERAEVIAGGPDYDGLRAAIRRVDGEPAWRPISGTVEDASGDPVPGAFVHEVDASGAYLSRALADEEGRFTIHAPPGEEVRLVATSPGLWHEGTAVSANAGEATLAFEPEGRIHVVAKDGEGTPLPVRVQIIPEKGVMAYPASFGVALEPGGRLHQIFDADGDVVAPVPPGNHRVIVSRGYEYELHDEVVAVAEGETAEVSATLVHSVDSAGIMCADFHIHSQYSADSSDPVDFKVLGAVADGLDIACSSEHEWVFDFGPVVKKLGLEQWTFGMSSSELTTFSYGHFGVVPLYPRPGTHNNGAVDWIGLTPAEAFAAVDALPEQPALIVNHPRGGIGGYFSYMRVDAKTGEPLNPEWSDNFDVIEVFNDASFDESRDIVRDWTNLLLRGMRVFAVGNSDSHHLRTNPVGYPRTCFNFGHDDPQKLTPEIVRDALLSGDSTISGGLLMTVVGEKGERPGGSVPAGSVTFTVTVEAPSWITASELEVLVDGEVVATEPLAPLGTGPSNRYVNQVTVDLAGAKFVLFHARSEHDLAPLHPGRQAFAVSNPIFVK